MIAMPTGSQWTVLLVLLSPAGLEGCLREVCQPDEPVAEQHVIERLVATVVRYGVTITGPGWQP